MGIYGPGGMSPGTNLNRFMDQMGFPDRMGDMYGAALDGAIGNNLGMARNIADAFSPLTTRQLDRMMSGGFSPIGHFPRPHHNYAHHFGLHKHTHYERESISTFNTGGLFNQKTGVAIDGQKVNIQPPLPKGMSPQAFEQKLMGDPNLRSQVERQLGGRVVYDGKADGRITVAKQAHHPCIPFHNHMHHHLGGMLGRCFQPPMLGNVLNNLAGFLMNPAGQIGNMIGSAIGGALGALGAGQAGGAGGAGAAGGAGSPGGSSGAGAAGGSDNSAKLKSILNDPNLSFEEKLAQFLFEFAKGKEKEIEKKMEEMSAKQNAGGAGGAKGAGGPKGAGGAKGAGGPKGAILGAVGQIGGGILGGLGLGPVGNAMSGLLGGGGGAGAAGGQGGAAGADGKGKDSEQIAMMKLQKEVDALGKIFQMIDNTLKSMSDVEKNTIRHIAG